MAIANHKRASDVDIICLVICSSLAISNFAVTAQVMDLGCVSSRWTTAGVVSWVSNSDASFVVCTGVMMAWNVVCKWLHISIVPVTVLHVGWRFLSDFVIDQGDLDYFGKILMLPWYTSNALCALCVCKLAMFHGRISRRARCG